MNSNQSLEAKAISIRRVRPTWLWVAGSRAQAVAAADCNRNSWISRALDEVRPAHDVGTWMSRIRPAR